jgi:hypothetical protein
MSDKKLTLGQAIDQIIGALEQLDETTRATAIQAACAHLGLIGASSTVLAAAKSYPPDGPLAAAAPHPHESAHRGASGLTADIRSLKEEKKPNSARQMACVVAFYLQELAPAAERKDTVSSKDLERYFKQAGFKLPSKVDQVLVDAKRSGYFESTSRGEYKLNAVGYNLVAHTLPSSKAI